MFTPAEGLAELTLLVVAVDFEARISPLDTSNRPISKTIIASQAFNEPKCLGRDESALESLLSDDIKIIAHTTSWGKARELFLLKEMWSFSSVSDLCFHVNKIWVLNGTVKVYADKIYSIDH